MFWMRYTGMIILAILFALPLALLELATMRMTKHLIRKSQDGG